MSPFAFLLQKTARSLCASLRMNSVLVDDNIVDVPVMTPDEYYACFNSGDTAQTSAFFNYDDDDESRKEISPFTDPVVTPHIPHILPSDATGLVEYLDARKRASVHSMIRDVSFYTQNIGASEDDTLEDTYHKLDSFIEAVKKIEKGTKKRLHDQQMEVFTNVQRSLAARIVGIERWEKYESILREIMGWREINPYIAIAMARRTGKTFITAIIIVSSLVTIKSIDIGVFAPSKRQTASMIRGVVVQMLSYFPDLFNSEHILKNNEECICIRGDTADDVRTISFYPQSLNTVRGCAADLIICDEVAAMDEDFIDLGIKPLMIRPFVTTIFLSTIVGGNNLFNMMLKLKKDDGTSFFAKTTVSFVCSSCIARLRSGEDEQGSCKHMQPFMPEHLSKGNMRDLEILNAHRLGDFARETQNFDMGVQNRVFLQYDVEMFRKSEPHKHIREPRFVVIGYDPHPGGSKSMVAIHAMFMDGPIHVILSQDTYATDSNPQRDVERVFGMARRIRNTQGFGNTTIFICPEANTITHANMIGVYLAAPENSVLRRYIRLVYEVKSDPKRPGIVTTNETSQSRQLQMHLESGCIKYSAQFFTNNSKSTAEKTREMFMTQLEGYQLVDPDPDKPNFGNANRIVASGKRGGNFDDMIYAAEIAHLASNIIRTTPNKYPVR